VTGGAINRADAELIQRISGDPAVTHAMKTRLHPGMVLVTTDDRIKTRTAAGFSIITEESG
jgi:hypothetical protein